jgi:ADP-heptose:LPS heptosyltransferase
MGVNAPAIRKLAIFRALQLGDLLCAVPAFRALRAAFPEAEITLIGLPWARELVSRFDGYLDRFLEFPGYPGLPEQAPDLDRVHAFFVSARREGFDLALQLHGSGRVTNGIVARLSARATAGFFPADERCPDEMMFLAYPENDHEIRRLLRLLAHLGIPSAGEELEFPVFGRDRAQLAELAEATALVPGEYVCIHPGGRSARRWPPRRFAEVGDELAARGLVPVLTGSAEEADLAAEVAAAMRASSVSLAGQTTLGALGALFAGARLLVSGDTGVSHLAAALRVPSVVVFTSSDPSRWAPLDGRLHRAADGQAARAVPRVVAQADELLV